MNVLYYTFGVPSHKLLDSSHTIVSRVTLTVESGETLLEHYSKRHSTAPAQYKISMSLSEKVGNPLRTIS